MQHLKEGETLLFDVVYDPDFDCGLVHVTSNGIDVGDVFKVTLKLDVNEQPFLEIDGYARDQDGRFINVYELDEDKKPQAVAVEKDERKFIVSGKLELKLEKEVTNEAFE